MKARKQIQISDAEWMVMKVLWDAPGASASEVADALAPSRDWHPKTIRTMLNRLTGKGILETEIRDRLTRYTPVVTRQECVQAASATFLNKVFDGALTPMVAHFINNTPLTEEDKAELEKILRKYRQEEQS